MAGRSMRNRRLNCDSAFCSVCFNKLEGGSYQESGPGIYTCIACMKMLNQEENAEKNRRKAEVVYYRNQDEISTDAFGDLESA